MIDQIIQNDFTQEQIEDFTVITSWELPYDQALKLQQYCHQEVKEDPKKRFIIICNHPPVYTMGYGLQKSKGKVVEGLIELTEKDKSYMSFPLYQIKRGGGLTFHHPGQFIIYPIINLNRKDWSLSKHFDWLLESVKVTLEKAFKITDLVVQKKLAGIWSGSQKIASIGVGVDRFVTLHGLALNLNSFPEMEEELHKLSPCGLNFSTYSSIQKRLNSQNNLSLETHLLIKSLLSH